MTASDEIHALIKLLQDNDPQVLSIVEKKITQRGENIIPLLENAWENSINEQFQHRIETLVHNIQFNALESALKEWTYGKEHDLLKGTHLIARYAFPDLQLSDAQDELQKIIGDAAKIKVEDGTSLEKVKALNHIMFNVYGFAQNSNNFYAPQNSYINIVLEQRRGNPISLAIVYMLVAQGIGLPVYGVNLPKNFILVYGANDSLKNPTQEKLEFYINPYNRGAVLSAKEIDFFAKQQKLPHRKEYYLPCSTPTIIRRILQNLVFAYQQQKQEERIRDFEQLKTILDSFLGSDKGLLE